MLRNLVWIIAGLVLLGSGYFWLLSGIDSGFSYQVPGWLLPIPPGLICTLVGMIGIIRKLTARSDH